MQERSSRAAQIRFGAYIMLALGGLIMALCGSCTVYFIAGAFSSRNTGSFDPQDVMIPLLIGGIPSLVGLFVCLQGRRALREARDVEKASAFD